MATPILPKSPTSPISPVSPTSIHTDVTSTPTSVASLSSPTWRSSTTPPHKSFLSELNSPTIRSPSNRSLQLALTTSPSMDQSFAERLAGRRDTFDNLTGIRDSVNDYMMTLSDDEMPCLESEYVEHQVETDGDEMVLDTPVDERRRNARDETWNDAILDRILELLPRSSEDATIHQRLCADTDSSPRPSREIRDQSISIHQRTARSQTRTKSRTRSPHSSRSTRSVSRTRLTPLTLRNATTTGTTRSKTDPRPQPSTTSNLTSPQSPLSQSTQTPCLNPPLPIPTHIYIPKQTHLHRFTTHLRTPLVPLISVTTGQPHPSFPLSLLQYHLLTHTDLDSLAVWYHQTKDNARERWMYPGVISRPWCFSSPSTNTDGEETEDAVVSLSVKRRRFGKFIGLRGCESPVSVTVDTGVEIERDGVKEKMEREWKEALRRAEEEARVQEKVWRGRW